MPSVDQRSDLINQMGSSLARFRRGKVGWKEQQPHARSAAPQFLDRELVRLYPRHANQKLGPRKLYKRQRIGRMSRREDVVAGTLEQGA